MADRKLFVNLPIRDLARSKAFFSALGFTFDPQFSGEGGACLVISAEARVMLVTEAIFKTLTERDVCDTRTHVEVLVTVSCREPRGGRPAREPRRQPRGARPRARPRTTGSCTTGASTTPTGTAGAWRG